MKQWAALLACCLAVSAARTAETNGVLHTTAEIRALSDDDIRRGIPVELEGQIVAELFPGTLIIRDDTGCYELEGILGARPSVGERVVVTGRTYLDESFTPAIRQGSVSSCVAVRRTPGRAERPQSVPVKRILDGAVDFEPVRVVGHVIEVIPDENNSKWSYMIVRDGDDFMYVSIPHVGSAEMPLANLVDADVELTGVSLPHYCAERLFIGPHLEMWSQDEIRIVTPPPANPFSTPYLADVYHVSPETIAGLGRRRVAGTVLAVWHGNRFLLREESGRIVKVELAADAKPPACGIRAEAVGFPQTDLFHINFVRSICRAVPGDAPPDDDALATSPARILHDDKGRPRLQQDFYGRLVRLTGVIRSLPAPGNADGRLNLESDDFIVPVDISSCPEASDDLVLGCRVELTGVCLMETVNWGPNNLFPVFNGFTLVLRSPRDVRILSRPSWWAASRLLVVIGSLLAVLFVFMIWIRALRRLIDRRGRELADERLASEQAKLRIGERTRLAVELHDSLSQNLTGVSFQIDAAERARRIDPSSLETYLGNARRALASCREELKDCLWDLRNNTLEDADAEEAIRRTLTPHLGDVELALDFKVPRMSMSDTTFHAVLAIIRELVVNAVRHGRARRVSVDGNIADEGIAVAVRDDGCGFDPENRPGMDEGHFGLLGVSERVATLGGSLSIASRPSHGTEVTIRLPIT